MPQRSYQLLTVLAGLSRALDLASVGLRRHHEMVALAARGIGEQMGFSGAELERLTSAALVHDVGVSTHRERDQIERVDGAELLASDHHAEVGAQRLAASGLLARYADVVRYHHERWDGRGPHSLRGEEIPLASRIIHVADRLSVLLARSRLPLGRSREVLSVLRAGSGTFFDPSVVEGAAALLSRESFVLDVTADFTGSLARALPSPPTPEVGLAELLGVAEVFAEVIDGKSPFTRRHSRLVARIARRLGERLGFGADAGRLELAGLLHDVGKMVIPEEILMSPQALSPAEFDLIRTHPYYSYHVLAAIDGFDDSIAEWAAFHHERLDGNGYPFHIGGDRLSLGARVVSVADIAAALCEDRPYRPAMSERAVAVELQHKVKIGALDGDVVQALLEVLPEFLSVTQVA